LILILIRGREKGEGRREKGEGRREKGESWVSISIGR